MVTIGDKEYRKPYILTKGGYQDMMRATSDKSVWNDILEVDPLWAEFLYTRSELPDAATASEIRYLRYLKQSEFKKYYMNGLDYEEMEYLWPGIIPGFFPTDDFGWDVPWRPKEGAGVWDSPEDSPGLSAVCDAESDGCYCPGACKAVTITANYPITGIEFIFNQGETVSDYQGLGTNEIIATICAPEGRTGQMRIKVYMQLGNGGSCDSTINIYQCDDDECCPSECDLEWSDASAETLVAPGSANVFVTGGTPPYTWEITSEDGKWNLTNSTTAGPGNEVNAEAGACGSATITVTDSCGCETEGSIRNPSNGSWQNICGFPGEAATASCCYLPGVFPNDPVGWNCFGSVCWGQAIQGKYREKDWFQSCLCNTSYFGYPEACDDCAADVANCPGSATGSGGTCGQTIVNGLCASSYNECLLGPPAYGSFNSSCSSGANPATKVTVGYYRTGCLGTGSNCANCSVCLRDCTGLPCTGHSVYEWKC